METVATYSATWLAQLRGVIAARTWKNYESVLRIHVVPALGSRPLGDLTRAEVRAFVLTRVQERLSRETVGHILSVLRAMLQVAVDDEVLAANPALGLWKRLAKGIAGPARTWTDLALPDGSGEVFFAACKVVAPGLHAYFRTLAGTAMRRGEGLGLQAEDADFSAGTITVARQWHPGGLPPGLPKGRRPRTLDLPPGLAEVLRTAIRESDDLARRRGFPLTPRWIFRSIRTGHPYAPDWIGKRMKAVLREAGLSESYTPKSLRHTVATTLVTHGEPPRYVQMLLGHRHLATTMRYVHERRLRRRQAGRWLEGNF